MQKAFSDLKKKRWSNPGPTNGLNIVTFISWHVTAEHVRNSNISFSIALTLHTIACYLFKLYEDFEG